MSFKLITTLEQAFAAQGIDFNKMPDVSMLPDRLQDYITKNYQMVVAIEAINEGWIPDYNDRPQPKYELWVEVIQKKDKEGNVTGSGLAYGGVGLWITRTDAGARLAFQSREKAQHFWKYFQPVMEDAFLIR